MHPAMTAGRLIGLVGLGAYPFLMHGTLVFAGDSAVGAFAVPAGLAIFALASTIRFRQHLPLVLAGLGAFVLIVASALLGTSAIAVASGIPHAVVNAGLLALFGNSLLPGRVPLVTMVSQRLSGGALAPELIRYTRNVTLGWGCFFAAELVVSLLLLLFAPVEVWSLFVNVLTMPLVVVMYLTEYAYRRWRFRSHPHRTILQVFEVFSSGEAFKLHSPARPPAP